MTVKNIVVLDSEGRIPIDELPDTVVKSSPPSTKYRVTNLYVDPATGKLTVEYDDTPAP